MKPNEKNPTGMAWEGSGDRARQIMREYRDLLSGYAAVPDLEEKQLHLEICSNCHPFFTGRQKLIDTEGRVERFTKRFGAQSAETRRAAGKEAKAAKAAKAPKAAAAKPAKAKTQANA